MIMYKLAFENDPELKAMGLNPKKLTLKLLEKKKPQEFKIGEDGLIVCVNGRCEKANIADVENLLVELAKAIEYDHENGFEPVEECGNKVAGGRCEYWMYCPRWE